MKYLVFLVLICLAQVKGWGQQQGNIWYFGEQAGLNFNFSSPQPLLDGQTYDPLPNGWNEGTSTICDSTGTLLFYGNGAKLWNNAQQVMLNGDSLMGHPSSTQAMLIVPRPGSDRYFYVFTTDASEHNFLNGLRYSIVDACLDNGLGGVVNGSKNILLSGNMAEKLAAVRHANGTDYWVIGHEFGSNSFISYRLTPLGIADSVRTDIGPADLFGCGGQMVLSPDGSQLAYAVPSLLGALSLFDFDANTGILSNPRTHTNLIDDQSWGVAFSPDGTKLYVTSVNYGKVFQYDLNLGAWPAIVSGRTLLASAIPDKWHDAKLGPDGRVYLTKPGISSLSRIEQPDIAGIACQFVGNAVSLGTRLCSFGLPNHATDYAYDNGSHNCSDPTEGVPELSLIVGISPNPTSGTLHIDLPTALASARVLLYDGTGTCTFSAPLTGRSTELALSSLAPGIYFLVIRDDADLSFGARVEILR